MTQAEQIVNNVLDRLVEDAIREGHFRQGVPREEIRKGMIVRMEASLYALVRRDMDAER